MFKRVQLRGMQQYCPQIENYHNQPIPYKNKLIQLGYQIKQELHSTMLLLGPKDKLPLYQQKLNKFRPFHIMKSTSKKSIPL